jgi:hypothetical protein
MSVSRVTHELKEPNGRKFKVVGTGATIGDARAEAAAKLALTVGAAYKSQESQGIDAVAGGGSGDYSDAVVILRKGTNVVSIHLENISNSNAEVVDGNATGKLDGTKLAAFAAAW